jgi:hypothetical protein
MGTFIVGLILAGIVAAIIVKIVRDKRKGGCATCSCGCSGCAAGGPACEETAQSGKEHIT